MSKADTSRQRVVQLRRWGQTIHVEPVPPELDHALQTVAVKLVDDPTCGVRAERQSVSLQVPRKQLRRRRNGGYARETVTLVAPSGVYPAALWPVISGLLARHGYRVRFDPQWDVLYPPRPLGQPILSSHRGLDVAIQFVGRFTYGLIRTAEASLASKILRSIAIAYPGSKIAVIGIGQRVETVRNELQQFVASDRGHSRSAGEWHSRITVGTVRQMATRSIERRDFVFFLDANHIGAERAADLVFKDDCSYRMFGFKDVHARLSPSELDGLLAWYGTNEVTVLRKDEIARDVRIRWCKTRGHVAELTGSHTPRTLGETGVVNNTSRNRLVLKRVMEVAADSSRPLKIAVLAYDQTHVVRLERLMQKPGVTAHVDSRVRVLAAADCTRELVEEADVLVRADGSNGVPDGLPVFVSDNSNRQPLQIVDFRDEHHKQLRQRVATRKGIYATRRWFPLPQGVL